MTVAARQANTSLPEPCPHCRELTDRSTTVIDSDQLERLFATHPHARSDDPRAVHDRRCTDCGTCWRMDWASDVGPGGIVRLTARDYRRGLASIRYGIPFSERRAASALILVPVFLASLGAIALTAYLGVRGDGWAWPILVAGPILAWVFGRELIALAREGSRRCT